MSSWSKSFGFPDNQNNWSSITWHRFYSSSVPWPRLLRRYHWASHVWKRRRASLRVFPAFPPCRWLTPGLVLLAAACCWTCVPRTAVPENLPRALCPIAVDLNTRSDVPLRPLNPGLLVRDWEAKSARSVSSHPTTTSKTQQTVSYFISIVIDITHSRYISCIDSVYDNAGACVYFCICVISWMLSKCRCL